MTRVTDAHPRPQLQRSAWQSLDGQWDFALDAKGSWSLPREVAWEQGIEVPFAPETPASGLGVEGYFRSCWYRRTVQIPPPEGGERIFLMFGAVDYATRVWVDGACAGDHEGGFTPFSFDITDLLGAGDSHEIVVRADDDPHDLAKPRGKQDWQPQPHAIWYPRTTGIWQTVWLERRPSAWIDSLRWTSGVVSWDIACEVEVGGEQRGDLRLEVVLTVAVAGVTRTLAHDVYSAMSGEVHRRIALSDPGIDDYRNELLWSPESPTLIDAVLRLLGPGGEVLDEVLSYTALRFIGVEGDRVVLNGRPLRLRLVLDQGYWPESGMTAPSPGALRRDVELAKAMGFNGVRKHQKIEDPRYLYWADHLGLLVWAEMPSAYRFTKPSIERLVREWTTAVLRDISHPCVVTWVPFNESWGVPDLASHPPQQDFVLALYHLTRALDPTRPVVGNDGWESVATDIFGIHDYDQDIERLLRRYGMQDDALAVVGRLRPGGRRPTLEGHEHAGQPIVLTEFGGIAYAPPGQRDGVWGYGVVETPEELALAYESLLRAVHAMPLLAGFCYTQFADTYREINGLLYADRTPKAPLERIAAATRGTESPPEGKTYASDGVAESRRAEPALATGDPISDWVDHSAS